MYGGWKFAERYKYILKCSLHFSYKKQGNQLVQEFQAHEAKKYGCMTIRDCFAAMGNLDDHILLRNN